MGVCRAACHAASQVFAIIDKKPQGKTCDAIVGITEEGSEIMKEYKGSPALDAGLLAAAQSVETTKSHGTVRSELGPKSWDRLTQLLCSRKP